MSKKKKRWLPAWRALDDGRDEDLQKARDLQQTRPEVVQKVDDQSFDVTPVVVLIRHDHNRTFKYCKFKYCKFKQVQILQVQILSVKILQVQILQVKVSSNIAS